MLAEIREYLSEPFVVNALVTGVLIALAAALLGVGLVLKRLSFIGDGLSHVAFGAMAVAAALEYADSTPLSLAVTSLASVVLVRAGRKRGGISGDAALAMLSVGAMAAGYLVLNLNPASSNLSGDVCTTLFGSISILTLNETDMILSVGLSLAVVVAWIFAYHRLFDIIFDEDFARITGGGTGLFNFAAAITIAVVIVLSMRLAGTLLVSALLVFPAITAMQIAKSFKTVSILAALFAVSTAFAGILTAIVAGTPVGATIVAVEAAWFIIVSIAAKLWRRA